MARNVLIVEDESIVAMELASNHSFPRHTHDEYGIGVVLSGAQRSWSGVGQVESVPGDVLTVNPGGKAVEDVVHRSYCRQVRGGVSQYRS